MNTKRFLMLVFSLACGGVIAAEPPFGAVGAVLPFNLATCPTGWTAYAGGVGRVVVGVGTLGSESYSLGAQGGTALRTLTIPQMPAHTHASATAGWGFVSSGSGSSSLTFAGGPNNYSSLSTTAATGGSTALDVRPPHVALLLCERTSEVEEGPAGAADSYYVMLAVGGVLAFGLGWLAGK